MIEEPDRWEYDEPEEDDFFEEEALACVHDEGPEHDWSGTRRIDLRARRGAVSAGSTGAETAGRSRPNRTWRPQHKWQELVE